MRNFKIIFSIIFVLSVAFFVVRACVYQKPVAKRPAKEARVTPVKKAAKTGKTLPAPVAGKAKIAVILDDWGNNFHLISHAIEINRPLTLSILPHLPFSRKIAQSAKARGLGVMLHMPMEALSKNAPREPQILMTTMSETE